MVQKAAFACLIVRVDVHEQISSLLLKTVYAKLSTQRTLGILLRRYMWQGV
jgi:hypothetical protein